MPRWSRFETEKLNEVKSKLESELSGCIPFPEAVGDRKILRFLRGHDYNIDKVCEMMSKFLLWRKTHQVDEIRQNIVVGGMNHPTKFPKGELILRLIPQLVISATAVDREGAPLCVERYDFSPGEVMEQLTIAEYIHFLIYCLEYKSLIMEQLSEKQERAFLAKLSPEELARHLSEDWEDPELPAPHGVISFICVVRDLQGLTFEHVGRKGQEILRAVIGIASDNYPELLRKCFMINSPWVFNALWYFVKGLLAARTLTKISVVGSNYMPDLLREIDEDMIPSLIGGPNEDCMEPVSFAFDVEYLCPEGFRQVAADPVDPLSETPDDRQLLRVLESISFSESGELGHMGTPSP